MKILFVITARGGSKGIPGKNIKPLAGKPLLHYSLEYARLFAADEDICLSTDSEEIIACAKAVGYEAPFIRPAELARDETGSYEVLQHAYDFYLSTGKAYDCIVLLQPTSPLREKKSLVEMLTIFEPSVDMVVSVKAEFLYHFYEEQEGYLKVFGSSYTRRQDAPRLFKHNGSIYLINTKSLKKYSSFSSFVKVKKYEMNETFSIDIDTIDDWKRIEFELEKKMGI